LRAAKYKLKGSITSSKKQMGGGDKKADTEIATESMRERDDKENVVPEEQFNAAHEKCYD